MIRTLVACALLATATLTFASAPPPNAEDIVVGTLTGETGPLARHLGTEATVVLFWATWSPRSAEALADFQRLYGDLGPTRLSVVAVNVEHEQWDSADADQVGAFAREIGASFPLAVDPGLAAFRAYRFTAVPSLVLLDAKGRVVEVLQGYPSIQRHEFQDRVRQTLAAPPPAPKAALPAEEVPGTQPAAVVAARGQPE